MGTKNRNKQAKLHQYRDSGLDNVWIEGGYEEISSPYGVGIVIHDLEGLHRCIAQCLVDKAGPLTGAEFRFLRTEFDLSQAMLGDLCGRGERTIRGWETRDETVEEPANTIVRSVYQQRYNLRIFRHWLYRRASALSHQIPATRGHWVRSLKSTAYMH